jgi:hypothetical protein
MSLKILGHYKKFTLDGKEVNAVCNRIGPDRFEAYVLENRKIKATGSSKIDALFQLCQEIRKTETIHAGQYTPKEIEALIFDANMEMGIDLDDPEIGYR